MTESVTSSPPGSPPSRGSKSQFLLAHSYFSKSKPQSKHHGHFKAKHEHNDLFSRLPPVAPDAVPIFDKNAITVDHLGLMHAKFLERPDGVLDKENFVRAMVTSGSKMSEEHLRWWFQRVDANNSGGIDWDEFSTFLVSGTVDPEGRVLVTTDTQSAGDSSHFYLNKITPANSTQPSSHPHSGHNHNGLITCILVHPKNGKYYTGALDGTVRVWDAETMDLELVLHSTKKKITQIVLSQDQQQIAVLGIDRSIVVYDLGQLQFRRPKFFVGRKAGDNQVTEPFAKYDVLTPDDIEKYHDAIHGKAGDKQQKKELKEESFEEYQRRKERHQNLIDPANNPAAVAGIVPIRLDGMEFPALCGLSVPFFPDNIVVGLSNGRLQSYPVFQKVTRSTILQPIFDVCPNGVVKSCISDLAYAPFFRGVFASSINGVVSLTSLANGKFVTVANSLHPIFKICWIDSSRQLATIGQSRKITLWSLVNSSFSTVLTGHLSAVTNLCVQAGDKYLVSMDEEKVVKVWDLYSFMAITTFVDRHSYGLANKLSALAYDACRHRVITGAWCPIVWSRVADAMPFTKDGYLGHQRPVITALFNPLFMQIITVDAGEVRMWEAMNGSLRHVLSLPQIRSSSYSVQVKYASIQHETIVGAALEQRNVHLAIGTSLGSVLTVSCASGAYIHEYHRMNLPPAASGTDMLSLQAIQRGSHRMYGVVSQSTLYLWKEHEEGPPTGVDRVIPMTITQASFLAMCEFQKAELSNYSKAKWRAPIATCFTLINQNFVAGTDCGIAILFGSSYEAVSFIGTYHPNVTVNELLYNSKTEVLAITRSDGLVQLASMKRRNRLILLDHGEQSDIPALSSCCMTDTHIAVGDDSGRVYLWQFLEIDWNAVPQFQSLRVLRQKETMQLQQTPLLNESTQSSAMLPSDPNSPATPSMSVTSPVSPLSGGLRGCGVVFATTFIAHQNSDIAAISIVECEGKAAILTAASDCQCRLFSTTGLFIGYCGAANGYRFHQDLPRMLLRTVPAPLPEEVLISHAILDSFLPPINGGSRVRVASIAEEVGMTAAMERSTGLGARKDSVDVISPTVPGGGAVASPRGGIRRINQGGLNPTRSRKFDHIAVEPLKESLLTRLPSLANLTSGVFVSAESNVLKSSTKKLAKRVGLVKEQLRATQIEDERVRHLESMPSVHHLLQTLRSVDIAAADGDDEDPTKAATTLGSKHEQNAENALSQMLLMHRQDDDDGGKSTPSRFPRLDLVAIRRKLEMASPATTGCPASSQSFGTPRMSPADDARRQRSGAGGGAASPTSSMRLEQWLHQRRASQMGSRSSMGPENTGGGGGGGGGAQTPRQPSTTIMSRLHIGTMPDLEKIRNPPKGALTARF